MPCHVLKELGHTPQFKEEVQERALLIGSHEAEIRVQMYNLIQIVSAFENTLIFVYMLALLPNY